VVRLRARHTEGFDPRCLARAEAAAVWSRPVASHRSLGRQGFPLAFRWLRTCMSVHPLVYQQPQQCFTRPRIVRRAWLDGLTDRVRGPPNRFPQIL
jgi:hypothetical protein